MTAQRIRLGVDIIGGEKKPEDLFKSFLEHAGELGNNIELVFFGSSDYTHDHKLSCGVTFIPVSEEIEESDNPLAAIRTKKDTSLTKAMQMLNAGELDGLVSIGNTGALVGAARLYLDLMPGIKRPALLASLPTKKHPVAVVDIGGNVNVKDEALVQFAHLGAAYHKANGLENPRIALLNIGHEESKGNEAHISAFKALEEIPGFSGNIEARDVFQGKVDVLVTDGFAGNIFLKTTEGLAVFIVEKLRGTKKDLPKELNYAEYPGALMCGVRSLVIKCHGYSSGLAIYSGVRGAIKLIKEKLIEKMEKSLS